MAEAGAKADKYKKGDRVFAKLKGYPPWPAQVYERAAGKEEKYFLHFYGTHDSAQVKPQMMYPYTPEFISKYGKPNKPSSLFKKAMDEIEANVTLYSTTDELEEEPLPEDYEEGELQIDESPPVLKREGKLPPVTKATPKEVAPKPARRISKATKRDSISISTGASSPVIETPPAQAPQPEIVSRSGRKIKPKRFADDEIGSPVSILAKAALQSSFEEKLESIPTPVKRAKKQKAIGVASPAPAPTLLPEPVVAPTAAVSKTSKEVPEPKSRAKGKAAAIPKGGPSEASVGVSVPSRGKASLPPSALSVENVESPEPSPIEIESDSNATPALSRTDEEEPIEDIMEEETQEDVEDKENSAGSWVNTAPEEDTGSEDSSLSKTEKHFTEIPVSPDESSGESIKITLAVKKDTEVEILYNHDKPKEFESQAARIEWDLATAKNALKVRQTLESVEPAAIELFNMLVAAVEEKEGEIYDIMEKTLNEKRANKLRKLRIEGEVIEIIGDIINCLSSRAADCDRAIELLDRLRNHTLDTLVLKKHPEIVETVRKLRYYEGNAEEWDLTQEETEEFDEKTSLIREKASKIYESFKVIFNTTADKPFELAYAEELDRFQEYCRALPHKDFLNMTEEPSSEPSVTEEVENGYVDDLDAEENEVELDPMDEGLIDDEADDLGDEEQTGNEDNISEGEADDSTLDGVGDEGDEIQENDVGSEDLNIDERTNHSNLADSELDG